MSQKYRVVLSFREIKNNTEVALFEAVPQSLSDITRYFFIDGFFHLSFNHELNIFTITFLIKEIIQ